MKMYGPKVKDPKKMSPYKSYGAGGPATRKVMPSIKGSAKKKDFGAGANVVGSKYC